MPRVTVKERARALMADGEPRTIQRIAYELNAGYSTVAQLVREGLLVKVGHERKHHDPFPHKDRALVVDRRFARDGGQHATRVQAR